MSDRDGLKSLAELCNADVRNTWCVRINRQTGEQLPATLENNYTTQAINHRLPK